MNIILEVMSGGKAGIKKEFDKDVIKLGRESGQGVSDNNDLSFDFQKDTTSSRNHCVIKRENDTVVLEELEAKNGTYVNGIRITRKELKSGDVIQCGTNGPTVRIQFKEAAEAAPLTEEMPAMFTRQQPVVSSGDTGKVAPIQAPAYTAPAKEGVGKRTVMNLITTAVQDTEKKVKKKVIVLAACIGFVTIGLILLGVKQYLDKQELKHYIDSVQKEMSMKLEEELNRVKKSNAYSQGQIAAMSRAIADIKAALPAMGEALVKARRAVVRIDHVYQVVQNGSEKLVVNPNKSNDPYLIKDRGSGFCIKENGYIITNAHLVVPWEYNKELKDKNLKGVTKSLTATFEGTSQALAVTIIQNSIDRKKDLAIIKVSKSGCPSIPLAEGAPPKENMNVTVLGYPSVAADNSPTAACSMLSGNISRINSGRVVYNIITHGGNSGGPVINSDGKVVAVHSAGLDNNNNMLVQGSEDLANLTDDDRGAVINHPAGKIAIALDFPNQKPEARVAANFNSGAAMDAVQEFLKSSGM